MVDLIINILPVILLLLYLLLLFPFNIFECVMYYLFSKLQKYEIQN